MTNEQTITKLALRILGGATNPSFNLAGRTDSESYRKATQELMGAWRMTLALDGYGALDIIQECESTAWHLYQELK